MITVMIAALVMQTAAPAAPDGKSAPTAGAAPTKAVAAPPAADPDKPVCRRQTPVGSTIEQRVCKTKAQWDADAANAQNTINKFPSAGISH
jgi:hypothetical protein